MSSLSVSVKQVTAKSAAGDDASSNASQVSYEGTVTLPGARPFKLCRRSDNETRFSSRSALSTAARNFAKSVGYTGIELVDPVALKKAAKAAASKTATPKGDA